MRQSAREEYKAPEHYQEFGLVPHQPRPGKTAVYCGGMSHHLSSGTRIFPHRPARSRTNAHLPFQPPPIKMAPLGTFLLVDRGVELRTRGRHGRAVRNGAAKGCGVRRRLTLRSKVMSEPLPPAPPLQRAQTWFWALFVCLKPQCWRGSSRPGLRIPRPQKRQKTGPPGGTLTLFSVDLLIAVAHMTAGGWF